MTSKECLNCGFKLKDAKFCPNCGQNANEQRYSVSHTLHDLPHAVFHIDSGFPYTFAELLKRPGKTCRNYIEGKRVKLTMPFLYMFVSVGLLTLVFHFFPLEVSETNTELNFLTELEVHMVEHSKISFSLAFLLTSMVSLIMYAKSKFNYIEHCLINSYIAGEIALITLVSYPVIYLFSGTTYLSYLAFGHVLFLQIIYPAWVYYRCFYKQKGNYFIYALICSFVGTLLFTFLEFGISRILFL